MHTSMKLKKLSKNPYIGKAVLVLLTVDLGLLGVLELPKATSPSGLCLDAEDDNEDVYILTQGVSAKVLKISRIADWIWMNLNEFRVIIKR